MLPRYLQLRPGTQVVIKEFEMPLLVWLFTSVGTSAGQTGGSTMALPCSALTLVTLVLVLVLVQLAGGVRDGCCVNRWISLAGRLLVGSCQVCGSRNSANCV